jgi:hypothetical protein
LPNPHTQRPLSNCISRFLKSGRSVCFAAKHQIPFWLVRHCGAKLSPAKASLSSAPQRLGALKSEALDKPLQT